MLRSKKHCDRRVERTKRLLADALQELLSELHYDDITVQAILDRADIGRSTFYSHFRNKDELLLGEFGCGLDGDPVPLGEVQVFSLLREQYGLYRKLSGSEGLDAVSSRLKGWIRRAVRQACRQCEAAPSSVAPVDPVLVESFVTGAMMQVTEDWLAAGMPQSPERLEAQLDRLVAACLEAARGGDLQ